jgi:hypothetical protein
MRIAIELNQALWRRGKEGVLSAWLGHIREDDLPCFKFCLRFKDTTALKAESALLDGTQNVDLRNGNQHAEVGEKRFSVSAATDSMTHRLVGGAVH